MTHPVAQAIEAIARGEIVVVTDDDDRENEGDLIVAASLCTTEKMAFIIRYGCGIVCAPLTGDEARRLQLAPMVAMNDAPLGTAFTVSVDVKHGMTTGISAEQRCNTVRALANRNMGASDFVRPGHVFPLIAREGGVLMRSGHTEAAVDLCRLAGLRSGGGDLRTRQRRRHGDGRAADRGLRRQARPEAHLGRRSDRLSPGAREAGRARRELPGQDADRRADRLRLSHAVRSGAAFRLRPRRDRRRARRAGAPASRRHRRRHLRRRRRSRGCCSGFKRGRPRRAGLSARRRGGRAGQPRRRRAGRLGRRARDAMARDRPRRADPARPRRHLDSPAHRQSAQVRRPLRLRHRDRAIEAIDG